MNSFDFLWQLLEQHGVIPSKKQEAISLWNTLPLQQQRQIYRCIRDKIQAGKFLICTKQTQEDFGLTKILEW